MSFQLMTWAVEQSCKNPGQKLVLLMLANHCNGHTGKCTPSHKLLADECCMGLSTLKGHLQALEEQGLLRIVRRSNEGVSLPNQYVLCLKESNVVGQNLAGGGSESGWGVGQNLAEGGSESGRGVGQNLATEPGKVNQELNLEEKYKKEAAPSARSAKKKSVVVEVPEGVTSESWSKFLAIRKSKRLPLTTAAFDGINSEAKKANLTLQAVVDVCISNNWGSFKAEWIQGRGGYGGNYSKNAVAAVLSCVDSCSFDDEWLKQEIARARALKEQGDAK